MARRIKHPSRQLRQRRSGQAADLDRRFRRARVNASAPGGMQPVSHQGECHPEAGSFSMEFTTSPFEPTPLHLSFMPQKPTIQTPRRSQRVATASGSSPTTPHHRSLGEPAFPLHSHKRAGRHEWQTRSATGSARFHQRLTRRYGARQYSYCNDHRGRADCVLARGARAACLCGRQIGSGKSTFLYHLALADIWAGEGVAVIDPHDDLALNILDAIPRSRINDVCYLDVTDVDRPVGSIQRPASRPSGGRLQPPA